MATHLLPDQRQFDPGRTVALDVPHIGIVTVRGLPPDRLVALCRARTPGNGKVFDLITAGTVEPTLNRAALRASIKRAGGDDNHLMPIIGAIFDLSDAKEAIASHGAPGLIQRLAYR